MKRLIVSTAVAMSIATATVSYNIHEHQVGQLQSKYELQIKNLQHNNSGLRKDLKGVSEAYRELDKLNSQTQSTNSVQAVKIKEQQEQIQRQSDKINQLQKQIDESPTVSSNWITFEASAYTVGDAYTSGKWGNKTASGTVPRQGRTIAVDKKLIPLGTKLQVQFPEPYSHLNGIYIAEDTGNGIRGHEVDLYLNSESACLNFGVRNIKIKIL